MPRLATQLKSAAAAAAIAAVLPATASAEPKLDGIFDPGNGATQITTGPDGAAWFTGGSKRFGRIAADGTITAFDTPDNEAVTAITAGPDVAGGPVNRIWLAYSGGVGGVIKVDPANPNAGTKVPSGGAVDANVQDMAADGNGNIWIVDGDGIVKFSQPNTFAEFAAGASGREIALGGDGRMWWADFGGNAIQATTTAGVTTKVADLTGSPQGIAAGPGTQMAFGQPSNLLGRISPGGTPQLATDTGGDAGFGIVLGTDGAYWTPRFPKDSVGRLTTAGAYTTPIALPAGSGPRRIAAGANNTLWVTLETTKKIARITGVDPAPAAPGTGGPTTPRDTVKPRLSKLKVNAAKRRLSVRLSEAASLRISIERRKLGKRTRSGKRRVRYVKVRSLRKAGKAGANTVSLGKKLKPASYRVSLVAVDSAGNRSATARKAFKVKKPKKSRK